MISSSRSTWHPKYRTSSQQRHSNDSGGGWSGASATNGRKQLPSASAAKDRTLTTGRPTFGYFSFISSTFATTEERCILRGKTRVIREVSEQLFPTIATQAPPAKDAQAHQDLR